MTGKKAGSDRSRNTGQWATKAVLERRAASNTFIAYAEKIARDKGESLRIAKKAGVVTKAGHLTKYYKKSAT